ncbi:hypothetical protein VKT23_016788 [Stygiomarasmius scandens]|uniref:Uncharacterized protein n=1 Tax=Marasmiellus scandens TaxID=2682957 RepID=A0ABR1IU43_9AGAR
MDAQQPALALSDIMHQMSPSPVPSSSSDPLQVRADATNVSLELEGNDSEPEPVTDEEVSLFRSRLDELGLNLGNASLNAREKELAHMVLRLTEPSRPSSAQLVQQASVIAELTSQRDFLIQKADEEKARWFCEKDGWERSAEALIAQRNRKDYYNPRNEETEKVIATIRAENAELRQKEYQTASRLNSLENEMYKLKPLLLLQPFPSVPTLGSVAHASSYLSSLSYPASTGAAALATQRHKLSRKRKRDKEKEKDKDQGEPTVPEITEGKILGENGASTSTLVLAPAPTIVPSSSKSSWSGTVDPSSSSAALGTVNVTPPSNNPQVGKSTTPAIYQHLLRFTPTQASPSTSQNQGSVFDTTGKTIRNPKPTKSVNKGKAVVKPSSSLTSDARTEHLLLAARKIGRERTLIVSGLVEAEQERERRKEQSERAKMGKEKGSGHYRNSGSKSTNANAQQTANEVGGSGGELTIVNVSPETINGTSGKRPTSPKTPKKGAGASHYAGGSPFMYVQGPGGVVYQPMNSPPAQKSTTRTSGRNGARRENAGTSSGAVGAGQKKKPPTPMDSLLDAARSMMGTEEVAGGNASLPSAGSAEKRRQGPFDQNGSPTQKKRRVTANSAASSRSSAVTSSKEVGRIRSALDVLADQADQAAAANEGVQRRTSSRKGKGKEVEKEVDDDEGTVSTRSQSGKRTRSTRAQSQTSGAPQRQLEKRRAGSTGSRRSSTPRMISPAEQRNSTPVPRMIAPPGSFARPGGDTVPVVQTTGPVLGSGSNAPQVDTRPTQDPSIPASQALEGDSISVAQKPIDESSIPTSRSNGTHDADADGDFDTDVEMEVPS